MSIDNDPNGMSKETDIFSNFLDYLSEIDINIPFNVKIKHINLCKFVYELEGDVPKLEKLLSNYKLERTIGIGYFETSLRKEKAKLESGEYYMIPIFDESYNITKILIYSKKNKINDYKEKVRRLIDKLIPEKTPHYNN